MYNDEDLNEAVKLGIFNASAVNAFRDHIAHSRNGQLADEENFRLLNGFNDIFVVIASGLLLASLTWMGFELAKPVGAFILAAGSWLLAEVFVIKKRMALPAICLLLSYLVGVFALPLGFSEQPSEIHFLLSAALIAIGAWLHWQRFRVPITVAASVGALFIGLFGVIHSQFPLIEMYYLVYLSIAGAVGFVFAMYWDAKDPERQTRYSDIAFWLHLMSAPLIVHPIFSSLGVFSGVTDYSTAFVVIGLYCVLALVSIAVDRKAIMVSALIYVVYAMSGLLEEYGLVSYSLAITGVVIGASLLFLSAYWQGSRKKVLVLLPQKTHAYLPAV